MDENKKNDKEYCIGPICYHCGNAHGHGGKHILLRWVIGLAILTLTFWMGMKIGELKSFLGFGYGIHSGSYRSMPMMNGYYGNDSYGNNQFNDRFWMMQ